MFNSEVYSARRRRLMQDVPDGLILLLGNELSSMNYTDNHYPFRQDSSFLYFCGIDLPHLAAIIDVDAGHTTLFGNDISVEDIVWTGPQTPLKDYAVQTGIENNSTYNRLHDYIAQARESGRQIHILPPYRPENRILLSQLLGPSIPELSKWVSSDLIRAIVEQRSVKSAAEIEEMEKAVNISREMHMASMRQAKPGRKEAELAGLVEGLAVAGGGHLAYPVIMTINGQTLHNHYHGNTLQEGQLLLGDYGAETHTHYAGDITRTIPVSKTFTNKQKEIYEIVLAAEDDVIASLRPGITFLDMHKKAANIISDGLKGLGIMKGDTQEAVDAGAHALFFPHGLGHMIGLDVHDMEDLGEDFVGYTDTLKRDPRFGYKSLRLARTLAPGFVLTVEPGIYFIPELITSWRRENKFKQFINYNKLEEYLDFGGIRIEDNVLITEDGYRVLGERIPKTVAEIEELRNS